MGTTLFVSYSRDDRSLVESLCSDLHKLGHDAYYDVDVRAGEHWWQELLARLEACDVFLPVLSKPYRDSEACTREADYAEALHKSFLPVAPPTPLSNALFRPVIAETNWVSYDPTEREGVLALVQGLTTVTPSPRCPEPMPARPAAPISYLSSLRDEVVSRTELDRPTQFELLAKLRVRLKGKEREDALDLLRLLRGRDDLYVLVSAEIDDLLSEARGGPLPPSGPAGATGSISTPPPTPALEPTPVVATSVPSPSPPVASQPSPSARPTEPTPERAPPQSRLALAVVTALLTMWLVLPIPFGIAAVAFSLKANSKLRAGDEQGARKAARKATWCVVFAVLVFTGFLVATLV